MVGKRKSHMVPNLTNRLDGAKMKPLETEKTLPFLLLSVRENCHVATANNTHQCSDIAVRTKPTISPFLMIQIYHVPLVAKSGSEATSQITVLLTVKKLYHVGTIVITELSEANQKKWVDILEKMDMAHSNKSEWNLTKKLDSAPKQSKAVPSVKPKQLAR